jgi:hypothetical protein
MDKNCSMFLKPFVTVEAVSLKNLAEMRQYWVDYLIYSELKGKQKGVKN